MDPILYNLSLYHRSALAKDPISASTGYVSIYGTPILGNQESWALAGKLYTTLHKWQKLANLFPGNLVKAKQLNTMQFKPG